MNLQYNTYKTLFLESSPGLNGHSIKELMEKNIPGDKLVIGKPVQKADAMNTGWVQPSILGRMIARGQKELKWHGGVMLWQYSSDQGG
jgi:chitinase